MNDIVDFVCMGFVEVWATGSKQKIQNENICLHQESYQRLLAFQRVVFNHSATLTVNDLLLVLLYYFGKVTMQVKNKIDQG